jgi:flagellin-like hook-associated protein FlgL
MNDKEKLLQEKKKLLEEFRKLCIEFPNSDNYKKSVVSLQGEIADISETLYRKK